MHQQNYKLALPKKKKICNFPHFMTRSLILCNGANVQDPIVLLKHIIKLILIKPGPEVDSVYEPSHWVTSSTSELTVKPQGEIKIF